MSAMSLSTAPCAEVMIATSRNCVQPPGSSAWPVCRACCTTWGVTRGLSWPGRVTGEIYQISSELERQLDEIEEVWPGQTGEYSKRQVRALLRSDTFAGTRELSCLIYEMDPARMAGQPVIASGDWLEGRQPRP